MFIDTLPLSVGGKRLRDIFNMLHYSHPEVRQKYLDLDSNSGSKSELRL